MILIQRVTKTDIQKGNIPGTKEIMTARRIKLKNDIDAVLAGQKYEQYKEVATYLLENDSPENIISALLKLNYQDGLTPDSFKKIDEVSIDTTGTSRLFIALGRRDGHSPRSLVDLIQKEANIPARLIDDVRVMEEFSFITVPFAEAEIILHIFSKQKSNGRSLVSKAKEKKSDGGQRREYRPRDERRNYGKREGGDRRNERRDGYQKREYSERKNRRR
jgi:ATP-dependent RNA helicase DeaD